MTDMARRTPPLAFALLLLAGGAAVQAAPAKSGYLEDVVIKAAEDDGMSAGKPPLEFPFDPYESIRATLKPDEPELLTEAPGLVTWARSRPERLKDEHLLQPWNDALTEVAAFELPARADLESAMGRAAAGKEPKGASWSLSIVDEEGKSIRTYRGAGLPPKEVSWDGLSEQGDWLRAGHAYSAVYKFEEPGAPPRTVMGPSLQFAGLVHKDAKGELVGLDSSALFGVNRRDRDVSDGGKILLRAAADWIRRHAFDEPILVRSFGPDAAAAQVQAASAKAWLAAELGVPADRIASESASAAPAEQRVDLLLGAR